MLRKILYGLLIFVLVLAGAGAFIYFKYLKPTPLPVSAEDRANINVIPLPAALRLSGGEFVIQSDFLASIEESPSDSIASGALSRFNDQMAKMSGLTFMGGAMTNFSIRYDSASLPVQTVAENESYSLKVTGSKIALHAVRPLGVIRGLETLLQLVQSKEGKLVLPEVQIDDKPRYPWRGLMIDVSRHWISKESILRNIELMSAVKLNVFHWHLSDYQAFRVESKLFPKLHELGSNGKYYSQVDIREVIQFARRRGIRVVPEFDMPGHATSWFAGYPELASAPGPYVPDNKIGLLAPLMDPTREEVYTFLDSFVGEMASLFPDDYFHIGGDEVVPDDWNKNPRIQSFMKEHGMSSVKDLQNFFNKRIQAILTKYHKKMVGWDEILHPELSPGIVAQSWRGQKPLFETVHAGRQGLLSAGWYLDKKLPASLLYSIDPEVLPGAITIDPDSVRWQDYAIKIHVSGNTMEMGMVFYGEPPNLRGLFKMMDSYTGFEHAVREGNHVHFKFPSDYGEIAVDGEAVSDSIHGKMSLGIMSFPFEGVKKGGQDMTGTRPPKVEKVRPLTDAERKLILGGEAALWTEFVSDNNVDTRIWPQAAAVAEKLWTPAVLSKDPSDFYRRMDSLRLYITRYKGAANESEYEAMISDFGSTFPFVVRNLLNALEEVKYYDRMAVYLDYTVDQPLNGIADAALPESPVAQQFNKAVTAFLNDSAHVKNKSLIVESLKSWRDNHDNFKKVAVGNKRLEAALPLSENLKEASQIALLAAEAIILDKKISNEQKKDWMDQLIILDEPNDGAMIAIFPGIRELVAAVK